MLAAKCLLEFQQARETDDATIGAMLRADTDRCVRQTLELLKKVHTK